MSVQLRNHDGATWEVDTVKQAFETAINDASIWKISWSEGDNRIRLVRHTTEDEVGTFQTLSQWMYEPIFSPDIEAVLAANS